MNVRLMYFSVTRIFVKLHTTVIAKYKAQIQIKHGFDLNKMDLCCKENLIIRLNLNIKTFRANSTLFNSLKIVLCKLLY